VNELALFAGAGGGILGGKLLGWRTVCAVERDAYAAQVLAQRQNDGAIEPFPIWSDVVGGPLNPTWVEWLMGWPLGWTDLELLATGKYLLPPQQHSVY